MNTIARTNISLGTDLAGVTTVDEALTTAGLDWGLQVQPANDIVLMNEDGIVTTSIPGMNLVMRDDTHLTLGVVGGRYQAVANRDAFILGDEIINLGGSLTRGGELDHGRKTFLSFELPEANVQVGGKDLVTFGFDVTATHDGTENIVAKIWARRLICTNGMTASIKGIPHMVKIRHAGDPLRRIVEAGTVVRQAAAYAKSFAATAELMISTRFTLREFTAYIDRLYPAPDADEKRAQTIWHNRRNELISLFQIAGTNEEGRGTAWAAYNAVTEYLDWTAPVRNPNNVPNIRAVRQFEGANQEVKDRAFDLITA